MNRATVVDVRGSYGHFRKNYSPASPVTFPCPTPTAVVGLLSAIAGFDKREYLERFGTDQYAVAIRLMAPVSKFRAGINLINTKLDPKTFRPRGKSPRIQIPFEFLRDPHFRIYFWHASEEVYEPIVSQLRQGTSVYTPSLGLAQCLAEVEFHGEREVASINSEQPIGIQTLVPLHDKIAVKFENDKKYQRFTVPVAMQPGRIVTKYQQALLEESGKPIAASGCQVHQCGDDLVSFFEVSAT